MATKTKVTNKSKVEPKVKKDFMQEKASVELGQQGHDLASLLWRKILVNVTPEVKEMLLVESSLACIWAQIAPDDFHRVPSTVATHQNLLESVS